MNVTWEKLLALLSRFKDGSVLLGVLYFIAFLLILPFWLNEASSQIGPKAALLLAMVAALLLVHILLNWAYYALVMVPAIAAIALFVIGASVWVTAPLVMAPVQAIFGFFSGGLFGGSGIEGIAGAITGGFMKGLGTVVSGATESISRFGQLLMVVAGWFWWLNDRLRSIDYKALGFYLLCLAALGFVTGTTTLEGLIVFLYVWLWITYRLEGKEGFPQLGLVFKIVASLVVLLRVPYYFTLDNTGLGIYGTLLSGAFLAVVWKFNWLVTEAPEGVRKFVLYLVERGNKAFFV